VTSLAASQPEVSVVQSPVTVPCLGLSEGGKIRDKGTHTARPAHLSNRSNAPRARMSVDESLTPASRFKSDSVKSPSCPTVPTSVPIRIGQTSEKIQHEMLPATAPGSRRPSPTALPSSCAAHGGTACAPIAAHVEGRRVANPNHHEERHHRASAHHHLADPDQRAEKQET